MEVVVRGTEGGLDLRPERCVLQGASIVPAPLMSRARPHTDSIYRRLKAQPQQEPRGVGADLNACADFGDVRRLLIDMHVKSSLQKL
ncbi:hypothetical protein [Bradyrhizobium elkanii]|uniref:hypothetical protein n=1 Tax=Bradyrhizobium elkanii TaxID=29448 RepID=UPI0006870541|nr:hypothetical protein [Bradyrhizobium elkanii]